MATGFLSKAWTGYKAQINRRSENADGSFETPDQLLAKTEQLEVSYGWTMLFIVYALILYFLITGLSCDSDSFRLKCVQFTSFLGVEWNYNCV